MKNGLNEQRDITHFWIRKPNIVMMSILPNLNHGLNTSNQNIKEVSFAEIDKLVLNIE